MKKFFIIFFFFFSFLFSQDKIVAIVGDKLIFEKEIIKKMKDEKIPYSLSLEKIIEEKLLLYQAEKEGINVTDEEIKNEIKKIKKNFQSDSEFYNYIKKQDMTIAQIEEKITYTIKINKLIKNKIIDKIEIIPTEISQEMEKIKKGLKEYSFYFKWFNTKQDCERFIEGFKEEKLKEMEYANLKSFEIIDEILNEIEKIEKGNLTQPIKVKNNWVVVYLIEAKNLNMDKYEIYKQVKDRIFKMKYSILYRNYIQKLKENVQIKFL